MKVVTRVYSRPWRFDGSELNNALANLIFLLHVIWVGFVVATPLIRSGFRLLPISLPGDRLWAVLHAAMMAFAVLQYVMDWPCLLTEAEAMLRGQPAETFLPFSVHYTGVIVAMAVGWLCIGLAGPWVTQRLADSMFGGVA